MNIVPSNEYLLVMPSGNVKGFDDYAMAKAYNGGQKREADQKAYINNYYYYKTRRVEEVGAYDDLTNDFDDIVDTVCYKIGIEEGECQLYYTSDIIEKLQDELVFNEEKEEVISKLMAPKIEFNTYDYALDNIFRDVQPIDIMEQYGDPITGQ